MKIRHRYLDKVIAWSAYLVLKALFLTIRVEIRAAVPGGACTERPIGPQRYSFCVWHDAILLALFCRRSYSLSALVSRHQDGTYLSDVINMLGIKTVRGSASRGGAQATKQLMELSDLHICITPDGPRGPRREMKDGIIYVASRTGRPVICTSMKATNAWHIPGGWSDIVLPKPFSKMTAIAGIPIDVPKDISRDQVAEYRSRVQDEMDRLDAIADRIIAGDESVSYLITDPGAADEVTADRKAA